MYCKHCGKEIASDATFCSHCGKPLNQTQAQPQPQVIVQNQVVNNTAKPKKPIYKRIWFWILAVIVAMMFVPSENTEQSGSLPSAEVQAPTEAPVTIEESVIFEEGGIRITVKGIEDGFTGKLINVLVENDTSDNLAVSCSDFVVNGISMNGYMYINVAAGKKTNDTISFSNSSLKTAGVDKIATISTIDAYVSDTDTYKKVRNIDFEISTSVAATYVQAIDDSGDILYENKGVTIVDKGIHDSFTGGTVVVLVKNDTDGDIIVQADNVSVNGCTVSTLHSSTVRAGTACFSEISLFGSDLEENEIESIEEVTFELKILEPNTFKRLGKTGELQIIAK